MTATEEPKNKQYALKEHILSEANVYKAIYSLESYVFEKGLLSDEDLKKYVRLADKYDYEFISGIISEVRKRLTQILDDPSELFHVAVYFKIKKWDEEKHKVKFRPLHTASLCDQICMVCMLMPLMFEDTDRGRKKSELTKLIPHNFYGNIPSTDIKNLFEPWNRKYKEYTEAIITHSREYKKNHRFRTEVTLDIKDFFPSIHPKFIYRYVLDRLNLTYPSEVDRQTLSVVLSKLLYFEIDKQNLEGWEEQYYGKSDVPTLDGKYLSRGVAQGLPQSYLFGNLCMIEIEKRLKGNGYLKEGDAYYYVDDSVFYIKEDLEKDTDIFGKLIRQINVSLESFNDVSVRDTDIPEISISPKYVNWWTEVDKIQFHDETKSSFCPIEDAGFDIDGLELWMSEVSNAGNIFYNTDEIEDSYSRDKLENLIKGIETEISTIVGKEKTTPKEETRLKLLKRYNRFFLYRLRLLGYKQAEEVKEDEVNDYCKTFKIKQKEWNESDYKAWFETFEKDIFQSEGRLLLNYLPLSEAKKFLEKQLIPFEKRFVQSSLNVSEQAASYLLFQKDFSATLVLRQEPVDSYQSLCRWAKTNYKSKFTQSQTIQLNGLKKVFQQLAEDKLMDESLRKISPDYVAYVRKFSPVFNRRILNTYFSYVIGIQPSDSNAFVKYVGRQLYYAELRILSWLRNSRFTKENFAAFLQPLEANTLENRMPIDMSLLEVLDHFNKYVKTPEWIDILIQTHRVVKGLWYNGSKFMNAYTMHNEEHAVTLIRFSNKLIKAIDYLSIKQQDYYILYLACYLHDISMVIHPNIRNFCNGDESSMQIITEFILKLDEIHKKDVTVQEKDKKNIANKKIGNFLIDEFEKIFDYFSKSIRLTHAQESANKIREWHNGILKFIERTVLSYVAEVAASHGADANEVYGMKSHAKDSLISLKYMMMLIRLADLMDVAQDRVNYYLLNQNVQHLNSDSRFHWISHITTDTIEIKPKYQYDMSKKPQNRPLLECLNFNLYLNVKYISAIKPNSECKRLGICRHVFPFDKNKVELSKEYSDAEGFTIDISKNEKNNKRTSCPILCSWIMYKHQWLVDELVYLQNYLNAVNNSLIKTEVRLNVIYRDECQLEPSLFDSVREYLEKR
jgi:hypothetical protein